MWCTINEPSVFVSQGYFNGVFPPGKQDPQLAALPVDPARVPREPLPSEPERAAAPVAARPGPAAVPAQAMTAPMPPMALDAALQNAASLATNDSLEASLAERLPGTGSADDKDHHKLGEEGEA